MGIIRKGLFAVPFLHDCMKVPMIFYVFYDVLICSLFSTLFTFSLFAICLFSNVAYGFVLYVVLKVLYDV